MGHEGSMIWLGVAIVFGLALAWAFWRAGSRVTRDMPPTEDERRRERLAREYPAEAQYRILPKGPRR